MVREINMKLYVWDKNNLDDFDNYYGESMLCVAAPDAKRAVEIVKEYCAEDLSLWHLIQQTARMDKEMGTWTYPSHPMYQFYLQDRSLRSRGGLGTITRGNSAVWKLMREEYERAWHTWVINNYIDPITGYGTHAVLPQEFDLTQEVLLISRAAD
jgi:hypothetical protein